MSGPFPVITHPVWYVQEEMGHKTQSWIYHAIYYQAGVHFVLMRMDSNKCIAEDCANMQTEGTPVATCVHDKDVEC